VGADSTIAPIFAGGLAMLVAVGTPDYAALAALLSVMIGIVLIGSALLRAGWVADLLSVPVAAGFMVGIAVHIIVSQLPSVLGVPDAQGMLAARVVQILHRLRDANPYALRIGLLPPGAGRRPSAWPGSRPTSPCAGKS
jgi:sulfate permease, SulP family